MKKQKITYCNSKSKPDMTYYGFLASIKTHFFENAIEGEIFQVLLDDKLSDILIKYLPSGYTKDHISGCDICKDFINTYGNLVTIKDDKLISLIWPTKISYIFKPTMDVMNSIISKSEIISKFNSDLSILGTPDTDGKLFHLSVCLPNK